MDNDIEIYVPYYKDYDKATHLYKSCGKVYASDFAILLGAFVGYKDASCDWYGYNYDFNYNVDPDNDIKIFDSLGNIDTGGSKYEYLCSIRPAIKYSTLVDLHCDIFVKLGDIDHVEYGEYPQTLVDGETQDILESLYNKNKLVKTGKFYTTDSPYSDINTIYYQSTSDECYMHVDRDNFVPYKHIEYELDGHKYVRVDAIYKNNKNSYSYFENNYFDFKKRDGYWVEVEPISWLVDEKHDIAISSLALISGIKYHYDKYNGVETKKENIGFEDSSLYQYLNSYFFNDMLPMHIYNNLYNYESNSYNELIGKKFK